MRGLKELIYGIYAIGTTIIIIVMVLGIISSSKIDTSIETVPVTVIEQHHICECTCSLIEEPILEVDLRYGFTDDDIYLLAQLLCGDAATDGDGEYDFDYKKIIDYNEVSKVLSVVMNRVRSDKLPFI